MDTIAITNTKGGVGKTTLALHLAVAAQTRGRRTRIIDMDEQQSSMARIEARDRYYAEHPDKAPKAALDAVDCFAKNLEKTIAKGEADGVDFLIIDTPPHQSNIAATAVDLADLTLVPICPGPLDVDATGATLDMLEERKAIAFGVVNKTSHLSPALADELIAIMEGEGLNMAPIRIVLRQDYSTALGQGLTAPEVKPGGKHEEEISAFMDWLKVQLAAARKHKAAQPKAAAADPDQGRVVRFSKARQRLAGGEA